MSYDQIGSHKTIILNDGNKTSVVYHQTAIVIFDQNTIQLNSGGWLTATTKKRMNQTSMQYSLSFGVYQKDFQWYVDYMGETLPFTDNMILER